MQLKFQLETSVVAALFFLLLASALLVPFWHSMPAVSFSSTSVFLEQYPKRAYENEELCFSLGFNVPENITVETVDLKVFSANSPLFSERFFLPSKNYSKEVCFSSAKLAKGDNNVEVLVLGNSLFFHVNKRPGERPFSPQTSITGIFLSPGNVSFAVKNFDTDFRKPVEIYVNGKLDHRVFPEEENQQFLEKIEMSQGLNTVSLSFAGKTVKKEFENPPKPKMPFPFGIAILALSIFAFSCFLFPKHSLAEKFALGTAFVLVLLIVLVFSLNYTGLLNFYSVAACFTAITLFILVFFRKRFHKTVAKVRLSKLSPLLAIAIAIFFLVPVFFHLFSFTHITYWNQFYERQSRLIVGQNSIPQWDELAYFGRTYSFAPGYFLLEAGLAWVTGLTGTGLYSMLLLLANAFLFFSVFCLGESLKLSERKKALLAMFVAMSGFLLSAMSYSPRHVFSFALFLTSLASIIKHDRPWLSGILLGVMAFIQAPLLLFFPLFYLIAARKVKWKRMAKAVAVALLVTALLMLPNLVLYGLPFQANAEEWGYLINYSLYYWFIDIVAILVFFVLFSLVDVFRGKAGKDFYSRKLFLGFILGTVIQMAVVYRWNILTTTTLALLVVVLLPEKKLGKGFSERALSLLALVGFGFLLYGMSFLNVHEIVTNPVYFVAENTSTSSQILSDPMFGHNISSTAERKVLADLRVEYADQEKLMDAYSFLEERDLSILEKYSVDYTLNQVDYIHKQAIGGKPKYGIIEFPEMDKIYSNGFIFIHHVPKHIKNSS